MWRENRFLKLPTSVKVVCSYVPIPGIGGWGQLYNPVQLYNIGNRRLFYPSPGIDFEVSGVKLDGAGVNSRRGGVGSLCCYYYYNRGRVHFLMYSIVLLYNSLRPPNALP